LRRSDADERWITKLVLKEPRAYKGAHHAGGGDMTETTGTVRLEVAEGIARLTFDNPRRLNAINQAMWRALPELLAAVQTNPAARVLVLAGAGDRAFCTGNDISEFDSARADPVQAEAYNALQRRVAEAMRELTKPAIAAIDGHCLGAGLELALQCDFRFATPKARMGVPAVKLGLPYRLEDIRKVVEVVGLARAREMVLLGRHYAGEELLSLGLVTRLLPDRELLDAAVSDVAAELVVNAPLSLAAAKVAFQEITRTDAAPDLDRAQLFADVCYASRDFVEGRAARREKRAPRFEGS
jgi:enoyl-CoA hydratase